ncbi:hypothetical protein OTU49_007163 [Cherax quadricarinatus]|uniref:Ig-like domain-containing protein n=1 Tax=Cherax quadricarinatus TaxID=27406 RepID=A0AAW0WX76_CHEQU
MQRVYITAVLLVSCAAAGDLLRGVEVPQYAFAGGEAKLGCSYDLRATRLYSLKWYHNGTEFYRYVPTERVTPINIKPSHKFLVTEVSRDERRVEVSLTRLQVSASGQYRCEVIAEHPSFRTEVASANMTVLREPLAPPLLLGAREIYEPSELIKIGCQPRRPLLHEHRPTLQWFLEGTKVGPQWVTPYGTTLRYGPYGLSLHVPGQQVASAGGSVKAECRLSMGSHHYSSYKTLRVRMRMISYVDNYHSTGSRDNSRNLILVTVTAGVTLFFIM